MKPRRVRRDNRGQVSKSFDPYYRREAGTDRERPKLKWIFRGVKLSFLLIAVAAVVFWGLAVSTIEVKGSAYAEEIEHTARQIMAAHFGWSNLLLLPAERLGSDIQDQQNERITGVKITKKWLFKAIEIEATDRSPQILWRTNNRLFTVDQTGRVIAEVGEQAGGLPTVSDSSNVEVKINDQVVPQQFVDFTRSIFADLASISGVAPTAARVNETTNELLVDTNMGFFIRFDSTGDPREQMQSVKVAADDANTKNTPITSYIDVRLPYKVFYR